MGFRNFTGFGVKKHWGFRDLAASGFRGLGVVSGLGVDRLRVLQFGGAFWRVSGYLGLESLGFRVQGLGLGFRVWV